MSIKKLILITLMSALSGSLAAQTYWLNMPGSYSEKYKEFTPSVSLPVVDYNACKDALIQFSEDNEMVDQIHCELEPLADAINLAEQWVTN